MSFSRIALGASLLFSALISARTAAQELRPDPKISAWIEQLGNPRFSEREQAARRLLDDDLAFPWLKRAAKSSASAEIRHRCELLVAQRQFQASQEAARPFDDTARATAVTLAEFNREPARQLNDLVRRGEIGRAIEILFARRKQLSDEVALDIPMAVAKFLSKQAQLTTGDIYVVPTIDRANLVSRTMFTDQYTHNNLSNLFVMAGSVSIKYSADCSVIVTNHTLIAPRQVDRSIVLASGACDVGSVSRSILFVDGDLRIRSNTNASLVICTGNVQVDSGVVLSTVIARGDIRTVGDDRDSYFLGGNSEFYKNNRTHGNTYLGMRFLEGSEDFFKDVRGFCPSDVGIELAVRSGRVEFSKVTAKTMFAEAGVQKGDILLAIADETVQSLAGATRTLRRQWAVEALPFIVRIQRGAKELEVVVVPEKSK